MAANRPVGVANTVKYGGSDVTVTIRTLDTCFYAAADGDGIPADERDMVFNEGYTTAEENGGTSLGLAFVQRLADVTEEITTGETPATPIARPPARTTGRSITAPTAVATILSNISTILLGLAETL